MSTVNMVQLIGNAAAKPEIRFLPSGAQVARLRVATTERWMDKSSGDNREHTEWHAISLFGRQAEIAGEFIGKGDRVYIQGRLRTRKWTDRDGTDRYITEILGDRMVMLGTKKVSQDAELLADETEDVAGDDDYEYEGEVPF